MGTDRKGPLAAFVVIAIVAAILLVTSVRSQAEPHLFDHDVLLPATVVAAPPIGDPLRWAPVVPVGLEVEKGVVLAPKPTSRPDAVLATTVTTATAATAATAVTTVGTQPPVVAVVVHHVRHHARHHARHRSGHHAGQVDASKPTQAAALISAPQHGRHLAHAHPTRAGADHGHGRHLGWRHS